MSNTDHLLRGLRGIRNHRRLTHKDLAAALSLCPASYTHIESGRRRPYLDQAVTLAKALGVSIDDLMTYRTEEELWRHLGPRTPEGEPFIADYAARKEREFNQRLAAAGVTQLPNGNSSPDAQPLPDLDDSFVVHE